MRPRHYTAENVPGKRTLLDCGFNEPAALTAGKLRPMVDEASMRPRHYTAENRAIYRAEPIWSSNP